jgi:hypothetical protein
MSASRNNPIVAENLKPGTLSWLPERLSFAPGTTHSQTMGGRGRPREERSAEDNVGPTDWLDTGRSAKIEGWCSAPSVKAGDLLQIFVSTNPDSEFTLDVYRMGYYGRLGARQVMSTGPISGTAQSEPSAADSERLIECAWTPSCEVSIPSDWVSGVYLGKLTRVDDGTENYVIFVVRDEREAEFIAHTSDFTWQAYNRWPSNYSLYQYDGIYTGGGYFWDENAVSFERPYLSSSTVIPGAGEFFVFEFPFTYWLEKMGYDVTYCSNLDTHLGTAAPARAAGFLSIGHDEYWTVPMYNNMRAAIDGGVSVGFFSGNAVWGKIDPLRPGASGRPDRVFSRVDAFAPKGKPYPRFPGEAPDEGYLIGARSDAPYTGCADWACSLPDHWVFEGTGMAEGDAIPNLVGHEWHGAPPEDIDGLEIVSTGTTHDPSEGPGVYTATVYPGPKGNVVFNASTCWWASGLAMPPGYERPSMKGMPGGKPDGRAQRVTENVLARMLASRA